MEPAELLSKSRDGMGKQKGKYVTWTIEMDQVLTNTLIDQVNQGNKVENGWKPVAMTAVIRAINEKFHLSIDKDNIRSRLKTWKKHYKIVNELINQSGFRWDDTRKMIVVDDDNVWNTYLQVYKDAKPYRNKVIENFIELATIIGHDHANGDAAKTAGETAT